MLSDLWWGQLPGRPWACCPPAWSSMGARIGEVGGDSGGLVLSGVGQLPLGRAQTAEVPGWGSLYLKNPSTQWGSGLGSFPPLPTSRKPDPSPLHLGLRLFWGPRYTPHGSFRALGGGEVDL